MPTQIRRDTSLPTRLSNKISGLSPISGDLHYVVETAEGGGTVSALPRINPSVRLADHSHSLSILRGYHHWDGLASGVTCPPAHHRITLDHHEEVDAVVDLNLGMTRSRFPQTGFLSASVLGGAGVDTGEVVDLGENVYTQGDFGGPGIDRHFRFNWGVRNVEQDLTIQLNVESLVDDANGFFYPNSVSVQFQGVYQFNDSYVANVDGAFGFASGIDTIVNDGPVHYPTPSQAVPDADNTVLLGAIAINPNTSPDVITVGTSQALSGVIQASSTAGYKIQEWTDPASPPSDFTYTDITSFLSSDDTAGFEAHQFINFTGGGYFATTSFSDFVALDDDSFDDLTASPPFVGAVTAAGFVYNCA